MDADGILEFRVVGCKLSPETLAEELYKTSVALSEPGCLHVDACQSAFRGIDAPVLRTLVGGGMGILSDFFVGLLRVAADRGRRCIYVHSPAGFEVRIPVNTSLDSVQDLLRTISELEQPWIDISPSSSAAGSGRRENESMHGVD